jgi:hypothetical protein
MLKRQPVVVVAQREHVGAWQCKSTPAQIRALDDIASVAITLSSTIAKLQIQREN